MDQVRLGSTGPHVSRVCPGMMSYGNDSGRPCMPDEAATEPIARGAISASLQRLGMDHVDHYGLHPVLGHG